MPQTPIFRRRKGHLPHFGSEFGRFCVSCPPSPPLPLSLLTLRGLNTPSVRLFSCPPAICSCPLGTSSDSSRATKESRAIRITRWTISTTKLRVPRFARLYFYSSIFLGWRAPSGGWSWRLRGSSRQGWSGEMKRSHDTRSIFTWLRGSSRASNLSPRSRWVRWTGTRSRESAT